MSSSENFPAADAAARGTHGLTGSPATDAIAGGTPARNAAPAPGSSLAAGTSTRKDASAVDTASATKRGGQAWRLERIAMVQDGAAAVFLLLALLAPVSLNVVVSGKMVSPVQSVQVTALNLLSFGGQWQTGAIKPLFVAGFADLPVLVTTVVALFGVWFGFRTRRVPAKGWATRHASLLRFLLQLPLLLALLALVVLEILTSGDPRSVEVVRVLAPGAALSFTGVILASVPRETDRSVARARVLAAQGQANLAEIGRAKASFGLFSAAFAILTGCGLFLTTITYFLKISLNGNFIDDFSGLAGILNTIVYLLFAVPELLPLLLVTVLLVGVMRRNETARRMALWLSLGAIVLTPLRLLSVWLLNPTVDPSVYAQGGGFEQNMWGAFEHLQARLWHGMTATESTHFSFGFPFLFLSAVLGLLLHPGVKALMLPASRPSPAAKPAGSLLLTAAIFCAGASGVASLANLLLDRDFAGLFSGIYPNSYDGFVAAASAPPLFTLATACVLVALFICVIVFKVLTKKGTRFNKSSFVVSCILAVLAISATILRVFDTALTQTHILPVWWFALAFITPLFPIFAAHSQYIRWAPVRNFLQLSWADAVPLHTEVPPHPITPAPTALSVPTPGTLPAPATAHTPAAAPESSADTPVVATAATAPPAALAGEADTANQTAPAIQAEPVSQPPQQNENKTQQPPEAEPLETAPKTPQPLLRNPAQETAQENDTIPLNFPRPFLTDTDEDERPDEEYVI